MTDRLRTLLGALLLSLGIACPDVAGAAAPSAATATAPAPTPAADPTALLARFKEASGGAAWDGIHALRTRGTVEAGGLAGIFDSWEELGTGRGTSRLQLGPLSGAEGFDGETPWAQDPAGEVTLQRGEEALEVARNEAYRTTLAWWYPERWPATLRPLAARQEGARTFAVVEITPRGGRPFELWLDRASGLLDRTVERGGVETMTMTFGDWRTVEVPHIAGADTPRRIRLPFFARMSTGVSKYDLVARADSVEVDPPLAVDAFAPPRRGAADFAVAGGGSSIALPFTLHDGHVYVDVTIDRAPVRVLFDSGGWNAVTPETAARLGLVTQGALPAHGVGEGVEELSLTHVHEVRLGAASSATLSDQVFYVLPLGGLTEVEGTPVGGVLGFEVLQRFVVEVDYGRRRLTLTLPERFDASGAGTALPFVFAGRIPAVAGSVDGIAGTFTIDTGSPSELTLNRPFVEAHHLVERYKPESEAVTAWGVGGGVRTRVTRAGTFRLGDVEVTRPVTELALSQTGALADRYLAGNVGGGLLQRFRVTFDYRRERIFLASGGEVAPAASAPEPDLARPPD